MGSIKPTTSIRSILMDGKTHFTATSGNDLAPLRRKLKSAFGAVTVSGHVDDALLMVNELVMNTLVHARSSAEVDVSLTGSHVEVSVSDPSSVVPTVQPFDPSRIGGNGLRIIEALADGWGVVSHPGGGKSVWFTASL
jgi:two-component sensor histidine kinase